MKKFGLLALAGFCCITVFASAQAADEVASSTVLSPDDVKLYGEIFASQKSGQFAKADRLIAKLEDKCLIGYVLEDRYVGPHYRAKFAELKSWLEDYGDLVGADAVYKLAVKRAPKKTAVPAPARAHWRGAAGDGLAFDNMRLGSEAAERVAQQLRALARDDRPEAAEAALRKLAGSHSGLPQADIDRLAAYVATAYLGEMKDQNALSVSEEIIARNGVSISQAHWTAGLASYRLGQFDKAAHHFESVMETASARRTYAAAAFWAARSWTLTGQPDRVLTLYDRAAGEPDTFYGLLATRLLGRDMNADFAEPALDPVSFAGLMLEKPAHRAVALWQIGHADPVEAELSRSFGDMSPDLDPAFAALARNLGAPALELRAAETAAPTIRLTSLYPVPLYQPEGGYALDQAVVLAFARQESRFEPAALSKAGARGVMQIMPQTAVTITHDASLAGRNKDRLNDPIYSITLGQNYLRDLIDRQNGSLFNIAAAYNAGEGNLSKWQSQRVDDTDPLLFIETIPLAETRDYVKRVMTNMWMYRLRLGEPTTGLDDAARGEWPTYTPVATASTSQ
ncbi:MAG TPA: lytic transglycosylase domain-containing protein [Micropepsaceae bacterium]|nr:lytic transglycosylase domain-containing protein [Micropepsaceae bacterium]